MRKIHVLFVLLPFSLLLTGFDGCNASLPKTTQGGGFIISTGYISHAIVTTAPFVTIYAEWDSDMDGAQGDASPWTRTTNAEAVAEVENGRVPAKWDGTWVKSDGPVGEECAGQKFLLTPNYAGVVEEINCFEVDTGEPPPPIGVDPDPIGVNPESLNPANPPATITLTGSGFSSTYGMPVIQYFDPQGNFINQAAANSVSSDGTTIVANTPGLSQLPAGVYAGVISNVASDGSYQYVSTASINVTAPLYRPTAYNDQSSSDPTYVAANNPTGPLNGDIAYARPYSAAVISTDYWDYDQGGVLDEINTMPGAISYSNFPSITFPNDMTLYIPYSVFTNGPGNSGGYYVISATVNGSTTSLYSSYAQNTTGLATLTIPAGTNLSSIQVAIDASSQNLPPGNPQTIDDIISFDVFVSQ
jgi:hypothetical protein